MREGKTEIPEGWLLLLRRVGVMTQRLAIATAIAGCGFSY
jgi:hypothetical protein